MVAVFCCKDAIITKRRGYRVKFFLHTYNNLQESVCEYKQSFHGKKFSCYQGDFFDTLVTVILNVYGFGISLTSSLGKSKGISYNENLQKIYEYNGDDYNYNYTSVEYVNGDKRDSFRSDNFFDFYSLVPKYYEEFKQSAIKNNVSVPFETIEINLTNFLKKARDVPLDHRELPQVFIGQRLTNELEKHKFDFDIKDINNVEYVKNNCGCCGKEMY